MSYSRMRKLRHKFVQKLKFSLNKMFFFTLLIGSALSVAINDTTLANRTEVDGEV